MQLKYGSQNLMLGKYRIRFTDKKYFALDLPIKNIYALETTMREGRGRGEETGEFIAKSNAFSHFYHKTQCTLSLN